MPTTDLTVFPVITRSYNKENYDGHGSAFFIDANGMFVTASHTFKYPFKERCAVIDGNRYEIKEVWSEYHDFDSQHVPIYKDLFIGRIEGLETPKYLLLDNSDAIVPRAKINLLGYSTGFKNAVLNIEELDTLDGSPSPEQLKEKLLNFQQHQAKYIKPHFQHINKYSQSDLFFENGFTIDLEVTEPHGHSGGPLVNEKEHVVGMLIGQKAVISSSYIAAKIALAKSIESDNTVALPSLAVPQSIDNEWLYKIMMSVHQKLNIKGSEYQTECGNLRFISTVDLHLLKNPRISSQDPGFGLTEKNYYLQEENKIVHLVIVSPEKYNEAMLRVDEIEAILMHEIGHILNIPSYEKPMLPKSLSIEDLRASIESKETVDESNSYNSEYYADDYVKQNGYRLPLISSLKKHLNLTTPQNRKMIQARIAALEHDGEELKGAVAILRKMDYL